jgi:PAS domain S-box-containing protein
MIHPKSGQTLFLVGSAGDIGRRLMESVTSAGIPVHPLPSITEALDQHSDETGALLFVHDAILPHEIQLLQEWLEDQQPWSDFPLLLVLPSAMPSKDRSVEGAAMPQNLGLATAILLDSSVHPQTLVTAVRAALRARRSQLQMRETLAAHQETKTGLQQHMDQLLQINEVNPHLVWSAFPDGRIEYLNHRWETHTGRSVESLLRTGWRELTHPDDRERVSKHWQRSLETGTASEVEFRLAGREGEYRWFLGRANPLRDANGSIVRWFGTSADIHERKMAENAIVHSEKLATMGRLTASIAHEINNPLEAVTNCLYLIEQGDLNSSQRELLALAQSELRRVAVVTAQTLRFQRQSKSPMQTPISEIFETVLTLYHGRIGGDGIVIERSFSGSEPVLCQPGEIRQVIANLIGNALDASRPGGRILLRERPGVHPQSGARGIYFTVADSGKGMSAATLDRLFEAFYSTKGSDGSGLGLWISRDIVERHGGFIRVRSSQRPGRTGSVFRVFLPYPANPPVVALAS